MASGDVHKQELSELLDLFFERGGKQLECIIGSDNHLRWLSDEQVNALSFPDKSGKNATTQKDERLG